MAKVSPRNLRHLASESINVLERYDETREKAMYYAQFSWEEVCRKRGGGPFTVPQDKVRKTTKGGAADLEGRINNLAHKGILSACYLVMLVVHMVEWPPRRVGGLALWLGFVGSGGSSP